MDSKHRKIILVTGGAGFIGSRLGERLVREGHRVISLDNYFSGSKENHIPGVEYREGHAKEIETHVQETPDLIYHLGEYARVEQSVLEPELVHDLNTLGTRGVVEFWKKRKCKLIYAGSSTKFGDGGKARDTSPYASTKAANTELVKSIGESERLPYAITYFYNVYGPGERAGIYGTVIEAFKQMYLHGAPLTVTSPGSQRRNFTHVDDIVDALMLVGEKGQGDEYGLGNAKDYSILEVAKLFGGEVLMLPPREGNRMSSELDTSKINTLGWSAGRGLEKYISDFVRYCPRPSSKEKRILVFSTTFFPTVGPAEEALIELTHLMPNMQFDIVTTRYTKSHTHAKEPSANVHVHSVGIGSKVDKYFLPLLGALKARTLMKTHGYLFGWSLMASYAAGAGVLVRRFTRLPLLVTLADQRLHQMSMFVRVLFRLILSDADQVYGSVGSQEKEATQITRSQLKRKSIGEGDAFANQIRFVYSQLLKRSV